MAQSAENKLKEMESQVSNLSCPKNQAIFYLELEKNKVNTLAKEK